MAKRMTSFRELLQITTDRMAREGIEHEMARLRELLPKRNDGKSKE